MTEKDEPLEGKIVETSKREAGLKGWVADVTPVEAFEAVKEITELGRKLMADHDEHVTKRQQMRTYEATEVARIKAAESTLRAYFDMAFAERRAIYQELFARMDRALDEGNNEVLNSVVTGIIDLAKTSPLDQVGDLKGLRAAWDDPDTSFDF